jgi:hypothetical protein
VLDVGVQHRVSRTYELPGLAAHNVLYCYVELPFSSDELLGMKDDPRAAFQLFVRAFSPVHCVLKVHIWVLLGESRDNSGRIGLFVNTD